MPDMTYYSECNQQTETTTHPQPMRRASSLPITEAEVRNIRTRFRYDPDTGEVQRAIIALAEPEWWFDNHTGEWLLGGPEYRIVGYAPMPNLTNSSGYLPGASISGRNFLRHMLVWALLHGEKGAGILIDHINGIRTDNRACNIRAVTSRENAQNMSVTRKTKTGLTGVSVTSAGMFQARISTSSGNRRTKVNLGIFDTLQAAQNAYLKAKRELHEGFAR